jgi:hypothetical protein
LMSHLSTQLSTEQAENAAEYGIGYSIVVRTDFM